MRHVKKFFVFLLSLVVLFFSYYVKSESLQDMLSTFLWVVNEVIARFMVWDFTLTLTEIIIHAVYCVSVGLMVLFPVLGLVISLFIRKKKPYRTSLDFMSGIALALTGLLMVTIMVPSDSPIVCYGGLALAVLLMLAELFLLTEMKSIVKVVVKEVEVVKEVPVLNEETTNEVVEEKVEEVSLEEENHQQPEEVVEIEEVEEQVEEPKDELLGRTFKVIDGDRTLNIMVVGVNDQQTEPVFSTPENYAVVQQAPVSKQEEPKESEDEENLEGEEKGQSLTYTDRLMAAEDSLKDAYSQIKNELLRHRKVHSRISKSCETFRVGYDVIAKLVVAGKGLKLYLALDPYSVDSAIYHQRDASGKKRFVEVPLVVKVKSNLSIKKAMQLIDITCEQKEVLPKSRYEEVDYSKIAVNQ